MKRLILSVVFLSGCLSMTLAEKLQWKAKVLKVMKRHCTETIGWPSCTNEAIFRELQGMWNALEVNGLVLPVMTFQYFVSCAHSKYLEAEISKIVSI